MLRKALSCWPTLFLVFCLLSATAFAQTAGCNSTNSNSNDKDSTLTITDAACTRGDAIGKPTHSAPIEARPDTFTGFKVLYNFQAPPDGSGPAAQVVEDAFGNLYTTTTRGGAHDPWGTVYELSASGTGSVLYSFPASGNGLRPNGSLVLDANGNLWGTTTMGAAGCSNLATCEGAGGIVFELNTSEQESIVTSFSTASPSAYYPMGGLVQDTAGNFYGVTAYGGAYGLGAVYKMTSSGIVTTLYSFTGGNDGGVPSAQTLAMDASGNLYGISQGGPTQYGVAFKVATPATAPTFSVIYTFGNPPLYTAYYNSPVVGLTIGPDGNLYGASDQGGDCAGTYNGLGPNSGCGDVYKLTPAGVETQLYDFGQSTDGGNPLGPVAVDSAGHIFGTTTQAGAGGVGVLFEITSAAHETVLHTFVSSDGISPNGLILAPDGNLYGTSVEGGANGEGTIWGYQLYDPLTVTMEGTGTGTITSVPAGIACTTGTCSGLFTPGATVSLTETPGKTATFGGWGGACSGTATTCTVTMSATESVTATFTSTKADTTTTTLNSTPNPSVVGQAVTFTATVTAQSGTPTGSVTFYNGASVLGTGTLSSGKATYTTSTLPVGSDSITAAYPNTPGFQGSTSTPLTQIVNEASTTTAFVSSLNPSLYGQSVTFTATITPQYGSCTGTVTFNAGTTQIGTGQVNNNVATLALSTLGAGNNSITAVYSGDPNCQGSTSASLTQTVNVATTTTAVVSSLNPSFYGSSVTFTANITPQGGGTLTGTVTFYDSKTVLGVVSVSSGTQYTTTNLAVGKHSITAVYSGDSNNSGSTSLSLTETVYAAKLDTTTTLVSSLNPSIQVNPVSFTATVTGSAGTPTGTVQFVTTSTVNGITITTLQGELPLSSKGTATLTTSILLAGTYPITAIYSGDLKNNSSTSPILTQVVTTSGNGATTTTLTSSSNPTKQGQTVTFTAAVSTTVTGKGTPTGTVIFNNGLGPLGTATLVNGVASVSYANLPVGTNIITATYSGDSNFSPNNSSPLVQTITAGNQPTVTWVTPAPIANGTALSATQLNAIANMAGTYVYTPPAGTVLSPGNHTLSVTFTPSPSGYIPVTATVTLTVNSASHVPPRKRKIF